MNGDPAYQLKESSSEAAKALLEDLQNQVSHLTRAVEDFKSRIAQQDHLLRPRAAAQLSAVCDTLQKQLNLAQHQLESASHFETLLVCMKNDLTIHKYSNLQGLFTAQMQPLVFSASYLMMLPLPFWNY